MQREKTLGALSMARPWLVHGSPDCPEFRGPGFALANSLLTRFAVTCSMC
jgi:hypothetical protein